MRMKFITWLDNEQYGREMSDSELARRGRISKSQVSRVKSGEQDPGDKFIQGVARALELPIETVYRAAGKIPSVSPHDEAIAEILMIAEKIGELSPEALNEYIAQGQLLLSLRSKKRQRQYSEV